LKFLNDSPILESYLVRGSTASVNSAGKSKPGLTDMTDSTAWLFPVTTTKGHQTRTFLISRPWLGALNGSPPFVINSSYSPLIPFS